MKKDAKFQPGQSENPAGRRRETNWMIHRYTPFQFGKPAKGKN